MVELDRPRFETWHWQENCLFFKSIQTGSGYVTSLVHNECRGSFRGVKSLGREAKHPLRMSGAIRLNLLLMTWTAKTLPFYCDVTAQLRSSFEADGIAAEMTVKSGKLSHFRRQRRTLCGPSNTRQSPNSTFNIPTHLTNLTVQSVEKKAHGDHVFWDMILCRWMFPDVSN
jgi:hypothetical protein